MTRQVVLVPLAELMANPANVKQHDVDGVTRSMSTLGMIDLIALDDRTGLIISGHGRVEGLSAAHAKGEPPPEGVEVGDDGAWSVPVIRGWASKDDDDANAALVALNRWGERGGWDVAGLAAVLSGLAERNAELFDVVGYGQADLDDLYASLQEGVDRESSFNEERRFGDAAHAESSYDDWAQGYADKTVRSIVLDYTLDTYAELIELAGQARAVYQVESNADLFLAMLKAAQGVVWPTSTPTE